MIGLLIFGLFCGREFSLKLPSELLSVRKVLTLDSNFYIYDLHHRCLWLIDEDGIILNKYDREGYGPGEFKKITSVRIFGRTVYICDWARRTIVLLDENLNFIKEHRFQGLVRDVLSHQNQHYVLMWTPVDPGIIKLYDRDFGAPKKTFGSSLKDPHMIGLQTGRILLHRGELVFLHTFLPQLEWFDTEGNLLRRVALPGLKGPLITLDLLTSAKTDQKRYDLFRFFSNDQGLYFQMKDFSEQKTWLYRYDQARGFERWPCPKGFIADNHGLMYRIIYDDERSPRKLIGIDQAYLEKPLPQPK